MRSQFAATVFGIHVADGRLQGVPKLHGDKADPLHSHLELDKAKINRRREFSGGMKQILAFPLY